MNQENSEAQKVVGIEQYASENQPSLLIGHINNVEDIYSNSWHEMREKELALELFRQIEGKSIEVFKECLAVMKAKRGTCFACNRNYELAKKEYPLSAIKCSHTV